MLAVTVVAAVIVAALTIDALQPINPGCFEFCSIGQDLALTGASLVSLAWLAVVLGMAWKMRRREPALAALSAIAAGVFLVVLAGFDISLWLAPSGFDSPTLVFDDLVLILAMGGQLPAIWRLGATARPSVVGRLAVWAAGLATLISAFAFVALGTTPFNAGPQVQFIAYLGFMAAVAALAGTAWSGSGPERPGLALVGGAAFAYAVIGSYYYISPLDSTAILLVPGPTMAVGWLWIGLVWLHSPRPVAEVTA
jgi:hypothetical protein